MFTLISPIAWGIPAATGSYQRAPMALAHLSCGSRIASSVDHFILLAKKRKGKENEFCLTFCFKFVNV
jgi:hypothetical protein